MSTPRINWRAVWPKLVIGLLVPGVLWFVASRFVTLEQIQRVATEAQGWAVEHALLTGLALFAAHAFTMALCLPAKLVLNLLSAFLLGPVWGTVITMGGVLAGTSALFAVTRTLLRERAKRLFGERAAKLEARLARRPLRAVAGLRMIITLPYAGITIATALTSIRYRNFLLGSFVGDLPIIVLYSVAGQRLTDLTSATEAISPLTIVVLVTAGVILVAGTLFGGEKKSADS